MAERWILTVMIGCLLHTRPATGADADRDGIDDSIDPNPGKADEMQVIDGEDYRLTVLGSGRVASLESEALFSATADEMSTEQAREICTLLYRHFFDEFDFIFLISNQTSGASSGRFFDAGNDVEGIGKPIFDFSDLFGSSGKLTGAIHLETTSGLRGGPSLHELAHNWGNSLSSVPTAVASHWGFSSIGGQMGGWKPGSLQDLGGGRYRARHPGTGAVGPWGSFANGGNGLPYSPLELYVMGLIPPEQVEHDIRIANDFAWQDFGAGIFTASSITTRTIGDVVAQDGARVPSPATSQKDFRILCVVLTGSPLGLGRWASVDRDVHLFSRNRSDGSSTYYNFWEATGGRATVTMDGLLEALKLPGYLDSLSMTFSTPSSVDIGFDTEPGFQYTLESTTDLVTWSEEETVSGTGGGMVIRHEPVIVSGEFFRVRFQPVD